PYAAGAVGLGPTLLGGSAAACDGDHGGRLDRSKLRSPRHAPGFRRAVAELARHLAGVSAAAWLAIAGDSASGAARWMFGCVAAASPELRVRAGDLGWHDHRHGGVLAVGGDGLAVLVSSC